MSKKNPKKVSDHAVLRGMERFVGLQELVQWVRELFEERLELATESMNGLTPDFDICCHNLGLRLIVRGGTVVTAVPIKRR